LVLWCWYTAGKRVFGGGGDLNAKLAKLPSTGSAVLGLIGARTPSTSSVKMGGVETANLAAEAVSNRDNVGGGGDLYTTGSLACLGDKVGFGEPVVTADTGKSVILVAEVASAGTPVEFADKGALAMILGLWWK
jgi:hypothetical protein